MDYLKRYQNGEFKAWDELVSMVAENPSSAELFEECIAVAEVLMARANTNVDTIRSTLISAGASIEPKGSPCPTETLQLLTSRFGPLPISLDVFYRKIGAVSLTPSKTRSVEKSFVFSLFEVLGRSPKTEYRKPYYGEVTLETDGVSLMSLDPLKIEVFTATDLGLYINEYEASHECEAGNTFDLPLCPDFLHKQDISGGTPYAIELPSPTPEDNVDPIVQGYRYSLSFVNYLRHCFQWGGFPGLDVCERKDDEIGINWRIGFENVKGDWRAAYRRVLSQLRKDLIEF
jgi:hypothetical protein